MEGEIKNYFILSAVLYVSQYSHQRYNNLAKNSFNAFRPTMRFELEQLIDETILIFRSLATA